MLIIYHADQAGVCNTTKSSGVEVGVNTGAELAIKAADVKTPTKELLDLPLAVCSSRDFFDTAFSICARQGLADFGHQTIDIPLGDKLCFAFGGDSASAAPPPAAGSSAVSPPPGGPAAPPPSSEVSQPSDPRSSTGNSCKSKNGLNGTCISTSACATDGGSSEPGHCPGGDDIQV